MLLTRYERNSEVGNQHICYHKLPPHFESVLAALGFEICLKSYAYIFSLSCTQTASRLASCTAPFARSLFLQKSGKISWMQRFLRRMSLLAEAILVSGSQIVSC